MYIANGDLQQDGGIIKLQSSVTTGSGGGLRIEKGGLHQHAGNISCQDCAAHLSGGCLAVEGSVKHADEFAIRSSGSIMAQNCTAMSGRTVACFFVCA